MKIDKKIKLKSKSWKFNKLTVPDFDNHVKKSVPFYDISHDLTTQLSSFFLKEKSVCYDLGSSTGTLLDKILRHNFDKKLKLIGIDESKAMIIKAKKKFSKIEFKKTKLEKLKLKKNDLTISLYTMQFVQPRYRQLIYDRIFRSLNWGGALILFEKIRGNDARFQDIMNFLYFDFKKINGLSKEEILNKELSLRSVLDPYTLKANLDFLKRAGFKDVMPICQYLSFVGLLAIK